ncbi:LamG-like jellyroll fold domain-containing protein [Streptomyces kroppenstedtii]|uniref:LamG-like jellyroll fold domain-containing protein n=1 Tax=Streptomyces kroppenstedtii TaxID=3051181 RepID=UPI0028D4A271|nr:LamG-like jellyroll fold domain-containing protein [Streptomyces sp. DSM 40484]
MAYLVEMGWGGLIQFPSTITWTDITRYADMVRGINITRGAADELSETQPGTATLTLDNDDGRFTPGNSLSPYAPFVRRNAPIRISVAHIPARTGVSPYPMAMLGDDFDDDRIGPYWSGNSYGGAVETGGRARIPVTAAGTAAYQSAREWTLVGSKLTARLVTVPGVNGSSAAVASMWVNSTTGGTRLGWRYNALTNTIGAETQTSYFDGTAVAATYNPRDYAWLRVRESAGTVYWESSGDGFDWTVRRTLAAPAWVASQTHAVELPTTRTGGTPDYVEWDLIGAEVRPRFYGTVNEFPVDWTGLMSTVTISCTDLFKRLNKLPALRSMVAEEIIETGPLVYFPLTDSESSTSAGDLAGGGAPSLATTQAGVGGTLAMASAEGPPETGEQVPVFTPVSATVGKWLSADLGPAIGAQMGVWLCMEAWFKTSTTGRCIMGIASTDLQYQHLLVVGAGGGLEILWTFDGTALTTEAVSGPTTLANDAWHHVVYDQYAGAVWIDGVLVDSALAVPRAWEERVLHVGGYRNTRLWNGSVAHATVYATTSSYGPTAATHYAAGMSGYSGEAADVRIQRLARYAGLPSVTVWGTTHDPIASQGPGGSQVMARMREVESTESGRLFAERDYYGLAYQSRDVRYNPDPSSETFSTSYADLETAQFALADDDQKLVNSIEASRPGGATQRVTAPASIYAFGIYDPGSLSVLKTSDNSVLDAANWRVSRYANPDPELREVGIVASTLPAYLDILDADIGTYFSVYDLPAQAPSPSARVTVEGYTETLKEAWHEIRFHTSASVTDSVWVLDDAVYSVLGTTTRLAY